MIIGTFGVIVILLIANWLSNGPHRKAERVRKRRNKELEKLRKTMK